MPMTWNAEADAKLLAAIMKVYNVRPAGRQLEEVAALMGPECTAKALTHRLAKFRNLAKGGEGGDSSPSKTTPAKNNTSKGTPKTSGRKRKADALGSGDDDGEGTAMNDETPSRGRAKSAVPKQSYAESDDEDSSSVKIKAEEQMDNIVAENGEEETTMPNFFD